ncbi:hypothetical protein KVT40_009312 [Elsinoe batatas]|uniref:Uncharacterized protein n=1 Tax=Elsinoe batatas TaxID=2601811 RepID=A0A8K0PAY2_9PEZI|nr:hypothetical protein KVT40_009312 [Elsinoe batatas]
MAVAVEQIRAPDMPPTDRSGPLNGTHDAYYGLTSKWPVAADLAGSTLPCRLEGEIADLVVLGEIPAEIRGTFYRVMVDPALPPVPGNVPLDGDGNISAFRFHDGRVDMKMRYVETERYKLERKAGKSLFGLYRNPFSHHPCVQAAVDSTANTNLILWANHLLALKESSLPYAVDPETLETRGYDPFHGQVKSKSFTAHPKIDPFTNELVVHGYEAKGLATKDIVIYHLDANGKKHDEQLIQSPWTGIIHDCAITPNFIVLFLWPFSADIERMKRGGHHWAWDYNLPCTFLVVPRRPGKNLPPGWSPGEHRVYHWRNCMPIHTAGAWEEGNTIYIESSRVHDNLPAVDAKADFVKWKLDLTLATNTRVPDAEVVLDVPSEFPRVDERFWTRPYDRVWLNVFMPSRSDGGKNLFHGVNGLAQYSRAKGTTEYFYAGDDSLVQEPVFIPRHEGAAEGDGWVMAMVERREANRNDIVVVDTRDFERPVAIVQLPFHVKAQVNGNWVGAETGVGRTSLVRECYSDRVKRAFVADLPSYRD